MQQGLWPVCHEQQHLRSFISGDCVTVSALQCQLGEESEETQMVGGGINTAKKWILKQFQMMYRYVNIFDSTICTIGLTCAQWNASWVRRNTYIHTHISVNAFVVCQIQTGYFNTWTTRRQKKKKNICQVYSDQLAGAVILIWQELIARCSWGCVRVIP